MSRTTLQEFLRELDKRCLIVASDGILESIERSGRFLVVTLREGNFDLRVAIDLKFGHVFHFVLRRRGIPDLEVSPSVGLFSQLRELFMRRSDVQAAITPFMI